MNSYTLSVAQGSSLASWRFEGSFDESSWVLLDAKESHQYFTYHNSITVDLPSQTTLYRYYRVVFLSFVSDSVSLSELSLSLKPLSPPRVELAYPLYSLSLFPSQSDVLIAPTLNGFSSFSLSPPSLPDGLVFSTLAGTIFGSLSSTASSQTTPYTITGRFVSGTSYRVEISLSVLPCVAGSSLLTVAMTSSQQASHALWSLARDQHLVLSDHGEDTDSSASYERTVCVENGIYSLTLDSVTHTPWPLGTYLRLSIALPSTTLRIGSVALSSSSSTVIPLPLRVWSDGSPMEWQYYPSSSIPPDWSHETVTSVWSYLPYTELRLAQTVWLFRRSFTLSALDAKELIEFRVYCRAGLVVVVNGVEVHRHAVPAGELTPSTTSTDPSSTAYWHSITRSASECRLKRGTNAVAIAVVNPTASERVVDFSAIIHSIKHSAFFTRQVADETLADSLSIHDSSHIGSHTASLLFDMDRNTFFSSSSASFITLVFSNDRIDRYNAYCLTSTQTPRHADPYAWTLDASTDGASWTQLDAVASAFFSLGEQKCSFISPGSFSHYRLHLQRARDSSSVINLGELGLFYVTEDAGSVGPLVMSETAFQFFLHCSFSTQYTINNNQYHRFAVEPALPAGVFVDTTTGLLSGTPSELHEVSQFTLTGETVSGVQNSVVFSLRVSDCTDPLLSTSLFHIVVDHFSSSELSGVSSSDLNDVSSSNSNSFPPSNDANDANALNHIELWILGADAVASHAVIVGEKPHQHAADVTSFDQYFCLPCGYYSVRFHYGIRTTEKPTYSVALVGALDSHAGVFESNATSLSFTFDTTKLVHPITSSWHYLIGSEPPSNWFQSALSAEWPQSQPAALPVLTGITSYYCTTFRASYASYTSAFSVSVSARGGVVVYLNGVEINRARLPAGEISFYTKPTNETAEATSIVFSGSIQFLPFVVDASAQVEGGREGDNNRLCIELHRSSPLEEANYFTAAMEAIASGSDRVVEGWAWGSVRGVGSPWFEYVENAFDKQTDTKFFGSSSCFDVAARWSYWDDRKEYVNRLRFYAGNSHNRRPQRLRLEASNDQTHWTVLFESEELTWSASSGYGQWKEWALSNQASYGSYQLVANGCQSEGIEFAEILLFADRVDVACEATEGFPSANEGEESHGPCPEYMTGYAVRVCQNGHFSSVDDSHCIPTVPTTFSYEPRRVTTFTHSYVSTSPTVAFYVSSFSIKPALPTGLVFNVKTGSITGIPVVESFVTTYTVTAKNQRGAATTTLEIVVKNGCPDIGDFPATPVGEVAVYRCSKSYWLYGKVKRLCTESEGMAVWGEPQGYCKSSVVLVIMALLFGLICCAVMITWCVSETVNRRMNVYQLPNGEYEMEEIQVPAENETEVEAPSEGETSRIRMRPAMKLVGRPVFLYIPRYFHKKRRDYSYEYHKIHSSQRDRI